jgi:hypothetical protein
LILPDVDDLSNCVNAHSGQSEWDKKVWKIECVFSSYDKMRWKWDDVYLLQGLPNIYSPSRYPPPLPVHFPTPAVAPSRCTLRLCSSEFWDALGGCDNATLEAVIECIWRFPCMQWSSEHRDALGDRDRARLEIHLDAMIVGTWRPSYCKFAGRNHASLEIHLVVVIDRVWRGTWRPWSSQNGGILRGGKSGRGSSRGRRDVSWDSIH